MLPSTIALWHFDEQVGLAPSDSIGNVEDLGIQAGLVMPAVVEGTFTGRGRHFVDASNTGLFARDRSASGSLLQRDATVQAILEVTKINAHTHTIYARGTNDGSLADRTALGLRIVTPATNLFEVRLFHHDNTGTLQVLPPGVYTHPGDGQYILLTATRTWRSPTSVIVRYYVDEQLLAEVESSAGDIAGGTIGRTTVGVRGDAGAWSERLNGTIDELLVADYAMSGGEVRNVWRRLTQHQPAGVAAFVGLMPPGAPWYDNPGNEIGKRVKAVGQSLGGIVARAEELKELWLPPATPLAGIGRWEELCAITPGARDTLEERNTRVVAHEQRQYDFAVPAFQEVFAEPFDLAADDVQILEFANTITDNFTTALDPLRWRVGALGTAAIVGHELVLSAPISTDQRYAPARLATHVRMPIDPGPFKGSIGDPKRPGFSDVPFTLHHPVCGQLKISDYWSAGGGGTGLAKFTGIGLVFASLARGEHLWFGVYNLDGVYVLYWRTVDRKGERITENTLAFPFVTLAAGKSVWVRILPAAASGFANIATTPYTLWASITGPNAGFVEILAATPELGNLTWAGVSMLSTVAAPVAATAAAVDDIIVHTPDSERPFNWYAFRDPALAGAPDLVQAQQLAQEVSPAHVYAAAIRSKSVLYDDALDGLYDRGPMGAW